MSSIETQQARIATDRSLPVPIMSIAAAFFCLAMSMLVGEAVGSVTPSTALLYSSSLIVLTLVGLVALVLLQPGIAGKTRSLSTLAVWSLLLVRIACPWLRNKHRSIRWRPLSNSRKS